MEIHGRMAINAKEIKEKFPSCDLLIYYADGNGYNYVRSHAGSKEMFEDKYYMDYNGDLLSYSGLNRLIFEGQKYTASIVINLTNGWKIYHPPKSDTENILYFLLSQPLTLGLISDACNPYVAPKKSVSLLIR